MERDASWSYISVSGAVSSLHRILCDNSIRNLGRFGRAQPTQLRLSGAIAGVVAGGLGAAAYALSCSSENTIPFIAFRYNAAIVLCALIGAQLGTRLLRW